MFIIKIMGGLGNQMFQYAFAKALCSNLEDSFKLDLTSFQGDNLRKFELNIFNITPDTATESDILRLKKKTKVPKFLRQILKVEKFDPKTYFEEKEFVFSSEVFQKKAPFYFEGFWQSEKYFKKAETSIRDDFTFKNLDFLKNKNLLESIKSTESVSIHIRRGDYVQNTKTKAIYDILTLDYYKNALTTIKNSVQKPVFYIFSDDPEWVKENLKLDDCFYSTGENHFEDFYLMQNCKHNIIANSSFSWWAAWLNNNPKKIVIAPNRWFSESSGLSYSDIVPENWIKQDF